jgi:hypothetical protein
MVWTMRTRLAVVLVALGAWLPGRALAEITRYEIERPRLPLLCSRTRGEARTAVRGTGCPGRRRRSRSCRSSPRRARFSAARFPRCSSRSGSAQSSRAPSRASRGSCRSAETRNARLWRAPPARRDGDTPVPPEGAGADDALGSDLAVCERVRRSRGRHEVQRARGRGHENRGAPGRLPDGPDPRDAERAAPPAPLRLRVREPGNGPSLAGPPGRHGASQGGRGARRRLGARPAALLRHSGALQRPPGVPGSRDTAPRPCSSATTSSRSR